MFAASLAEAQALQRESEMSPCNVCGRSPATPRERGVFNITVSFEEFGHACGYCIIWAITYAMRQEYYHRRVPKT